MEFRVNDIKKVMRLRKLYEEKVGQLKLMAEMALHENMISTIDEITDLRGQIISELNHSVFALRYEEKYVLRKYGNEDLFLCLTPVENMGLAKFKGSLESLDKATIFDTEEAATEQIDPYNHSIFRSFLNMGRK